ncbi:MAG: HD domain-containing phosphohydrolase [Bacillota bacterium]
MQSAVQVNEIDELRQQVRNLNKELRERSLILEMTNLLLKGQVLESTINYTLDLAVKLTRSEAGCLLLNDDNNDNRLKIFKIIGEIPQSLVKAFCEFSPKYLPQNISQIKQLNKEKKVFGRFNNLDKMLESLIIIPLAISNRIIGYAFIMHRHNEKQNHSCNYSSEDLRSLQIFAHQTALLLENVRLKIEQGRKEVYLKTISSLVSAIDAKDIYTQNHSVRVASLTVKFAKKIGISEPIINNYHYGALLHDIGKIGIKDAILNKPGKLSMTEFQKIKDHPSLGAKILMPMEPDEEILDIVRYHHERYDGNGYPNGLKGEKIPLGARLVSIVDAFDAMTSDRSYRKKLSLQKVVEEIKRGAGTQFDPYLAKEFIDLIKNGKQEIHFNY